MSQYAPNRLDLADGFADADGNAIEDLPSTTFTMIFASLPTGAMSMTIESRYPSAEAMQQLLQMVMGAGLRSAMTQIDAVLAQG